MSRQRRHLSPWFGGLVALLAMAGLVTAGWGLASAFQSPEQREARARAPQPLPIYETVERGRLEDGASGRGTIRFPTTRTLAPTQLPENAVVTRSKVAVNSVVTNGTVITELNGRPVLVLAGAFAFYRDLRLHDHGPDVAQFQQALRAVGYAIEADGTFGDATLHATRRFYRSRGYVLAGKTVPLTELISVPRLPAVVVSILSVGDLPGSDRQVARLGSGDLHAVVEVDGAVGARLDRRTTTTLAIRGRKQVQGRIVRIRDTQRGFTSVVISASQALRPHHNGSPVVARFSLTRIAPDALLVPTRAVTFDAENRAWVLVREGGSSKRVQVAVLGELAGLRALALGGELRAGDQVRVG